ncbi:ABC transporter permease [Aquirufa sp. A-Brett2-W8]
MELEKSESWDTIIEPKSTSLNLGLGKVWKYRDLLLLLVRRDLVSFYKQTILGPLWFFIQPLFTTITFTFIFGQLAEISTDGLPQPLFYMTGITIWNYFSESLNKTSTVFRDNAGIFGKVYFPRLIIPISIILSNLLKFAVQILLLFIMMLFYLYRGANFSPTIFLFLFPIQIILMAALGLGMGMIITALTNKYRDLSFLVVFGVQLLMYATPVIYPLSVVTNKYKWIVTLNPMTQIVEISRLGLLGKGEFSLPTFIYTILMSITILLSGIIIFNKVEKTFIDTV